MTLRNRLVAMGRRSLSNLPRFQIRVGIAVSRPPVRRSYRRRSPHGPRLAPARASCGQRQGELGGRGAVIGSHKVAAARKAAKGHEAWEPWAGIGCRRLVDDMEVTGRKGPSR